MRRPLFAVALFLVILAALRLKSGWAEETPPGCISAGRLEADREVEVTGQVYQKDETTIYLKSVFLIQTDLSGSSAFGQSAAGSRQEIPIQENIICETEKAEEISLGSHVAVRGQFAPYAHATNPGEFDAAVYYRTLEIGGKLKKAVVLAKGEASWPVREGLYQLKVYFKERLYRIFPEQEAAVMAALLLGDKSELDSDLKELYKRNGVLHILSISSLHITIIGMSIYRLLRKMGLPVCPCALAGSVILILYGCMTGFSVSACRAIGMYLIKMGAEIAGRTYDMLTALGVMGAFMVLRNPFYLQNSGFLLSFSSVLGIGVVYPLLMPEISLGKGVGKSVSGKHSRSEKARFTKSLAAAAGFAGDALIQSFFASLSITLTTLPVQLWFYYEIPVYSVFLNLFIIPFLKPMMITGLLAMLVPGLGVLGTADRLILRSYEFLCGCFDRLPFHTWNPGCPEIWQVVVFYLLLGGAVMVKYTIKQIKYIAKETKTVIPGHSFQMEETVKTRKKTETREKTEMRKAAGKGKTNNPKSTAGSGIFHRMSEFLKSPKATGCAAIGALCLGVLLFEIRPSAGNSVTFLDVGQGDSILVRTASGETYLFDCGSSSRKKIGKYILIPYLKYNGIRTIDAVFLSHPDGDHVNGAVELFALGGENHITVHQLLLPDIEETAREEQFGTLLQAALEGAQGQPIAVGYLSAGDGWRCGSASFTCLHPEKGFGAQDVNAYSECFLVEFYEDGTRFQSGISGGAVREAGAAGGSPSPPAQWTLLLTGDVQDKGEKALLREIQERNIGGITVLKAAHHGSRNSTPEALLDQLKPFLTVISCGRDNRYGHPHEELLERLEACGTHILQTAQWGAVRMEYEDGSLAVWTGAE